MQILIHNKYKILKKLSQGSFGQIFHAINITTGQQLAVKLQKKDTQYPQLLHEAKIMTELCNNSIITDKGIPNVYHCGTQGDYNVMVMDLLGKNLQQLLKQNGGTFSIKTTLMLFLQIIKRLQYIHTRNYLHRDIKPQNFTLGLNPNKQKIFLIDFGLSKKYTTKNHHIEYSQGHTITGTVRYASINVHLGVQPTRRDDLESVVFVVYYFLYGKLPWQGIVCQGVKEKYSRILAGKIEQKPEVLFGNLAVEIRQELTDIFKHVRGLKFDQKPNYEFIKQKITQAMRNSGFENDFMFDWCQEKGKQTVDKSRATSLMKSKVMQKSNNKASIHQRKGSGLGQSNDKLQKQSTSNKQQQLKQQTLIQTLQRLKGIKTPTKK